MKAVSAEFANNARSVEALTAKGDVLQRQYDAQAKKLDVLQNALKSAKTAQDDTAKRVEEARQKYEQAQRELEDYGDVAGGSAEEQARLQAAVEDAAKELELAERAQQKSTNSVNSYQKQVNYAQADLYKLNGELEDNARALEEAKNEADDAASVVDELGDSMEDAADAGEEMGDRVKEGVDALSAALVAGGVKKGVEEITKDLWDCLDASVAFRKGMSETFTLMPEASQQMRDALTNDAKVIMTEYAVMSNDLTGSLYQAVSAGVDAAESTQFLTLAQKAAVGGVTSLTTAVDGITSVTNAYGKENLSAEKAADLMFTAVRYGKTTFDELSSSLYNVVPIASNSKIAFGNITAALASMTAQGIPTAQSTTQLRQMLVELTDSGSAVNKTFLEVAGVSFKEFIASGGNVSEALTVLEGAAENSGLSINELFGSVEAGNAALALSGQNAERYAENIKNMENSAGACETAFSEMASTTDYSAQKFAASTTALQIAIGEQLEPALKNMYDTGADAFTWAADFVEQNPWVVGSITAVTAAMALLAVGVAGVNVAVNIVIPAIQTFNAALTANPTGLTAVAIAALIGAIAGLAIAFNNTEDPNAKYVARAKEAEAATDALIESVEGLEDALEDIDFNTKTAEDYVATMRLLEEQGLNTAAAQALYAEQVEALNALFPELELAIDETTGKLNMSTEELLLNIEAWGQTENQKTAMEVYTQAQVTVDDTTAALEANREEQERLALEADILREKMFDVNSEVEMGSEQWNEMRDRLVEIETETFPHLRLEEDALNDEIKI